MDIGLYLFFFALGITAIHTYFKIRYDRSSSFDMKEHKATMHRATNLINRTECICSPECLKQSKMIRLNDILSGHDYA